MLIYDFMHHAVAALSKGRADISVHLMLFDDKIFAEKNGDRASDACWQMAPSLAKRTTPPMVFARLLQT